MRILLCGLIASLTLPSLLSARERYPYDSVAHASNIERYYSGSYLDVLPISIQLGLDETFDDQEVGIIDRAMRIFVDRALDERILNCAFRHSYRHMPASRQSFIDRLYLAISPVYVNGQPLPAFAFILRIQTEFTLRLWVIFISLPKSVGFIVPTTAVKLGNASYLPTKMQGQWI